MSTNIHLSRPGSSPTTARTRSPNAFQSVRVLTLKVEHEKVDCGYINRVLPEIKVLVMVNNDLSDHDFAQLDLFRMVTELNTLVIQSQNITDISLDLLVNALMEMRGKISLKQLILKDNKKITTRGVIALGVWVNNYRKEFHVQFDGNQHVKLQKNLRGLGLGPLDAGFLSPILKMDTKLTILRLDQNRIGSYGAIALARALHKNTTLQEIDLRANQIGTLGWKAIYGALCANKSLLYTDIRDNHQIKFSRNLGEKLRNDMKRVWPALSKMVLFVDVGTWQGANGQYIENSNRAGQKKQPPSPKNKHRGKFSKRRPQPIQCHKKLKEMHKLYEKDALLNKDPRLKEDLQQEKIRPDKASYMKWKNEYDQVTFDESRMQLVLGSEEEDPQEVEQKFVTDDDDAEKPQMEEHHDQNEDDDNSKALASFGSKIENMFGSSKPKHGVRRRSKVLTVDVSQDALSATILIQSLVRGHLARKRATIMLSVRKLMFDQAATRAAEKVQRLIRTRARENMRRRTKCATTIQKSYRRYFTVTRLVPLGRKLAQEGYLQPNKKLQNTNRVYVSGGLDVEATGIYKVVVKGSQMNINGREEPSKRFLMDRYQISRDEEDGTWTIQDNEFIDNPRVVWKNSTARTAKLPPGFGWKLGGAEKLQSNKTSPKGKPVLHFPVPRDVSGEEEVEAEESKEADDDWFLDQKFIKISCSGSNEINGTYVQVTNPKNGAAPAFEKRDTKSTIIYGLRKVSYLQNHPPVWALFSFSEENMMEFLVYYYSLDDIMRNEHAEWKRGTKGLFPIPLVQVQTIRQDMESQTNLGLDRDRSTTPVDTRQRATVRIQRAYRHHCIRKLTQSSYTLKAISRITALMVKDAGKDDAIGVYKCFGTTSLCGDVSKTQNTTMTYIRDLDGNDDGKGDVYVVERIRGGTTWALLHVQGDNSPPDIIYYNRTHGHSLFPPKNGWVASNACHDPCPEIEWIETSKEEAEANISKNAVMVTDSGSLTVHGRYEEQGASDGVSAYICVRDKHIHLRRVLHGQQKLWIIVKITPTNESNVIYYYNVAHGNDDHPPLDNWLCYTGADPTPLVVIQKKKED